MPSCYFYQHRNEVVYFVAVRYSVGGVELTKITSSADPHLEINSGKKDLGEVNYGKVLSLSSIM